MIQWGTGNYDLIYGNHGSLEPYPIGGLDYGESSFDGNMGHNDWKIHMGYGNMHMTINNRESQRSRIIAILENHES